MFPACDVVLHNWKLSDPCDHVVFRDDSARDFALAFDQMDRRSFRDTNDIEFDCLSSVAMGMQFANVNIPTVFAFCDVCGDQFKGPLKCEVQQGVRGGEAANECC